MELYEKVQLIVDYLKENSEAFSMVEKNTIINSIGTFDTTDKIPSVVLELYDELGILPDNKNIYKAFLKLLDEKFKIKDKNIVEVGGGNLPRLGKRIALMQDKGTITVYDPNLYIKNNDLPNLKLIKRRFYPISNVDDADVIIGLMPCGAVQSIVKSAIRHDKDFMLVLCDEFDTFCQFDSEIENENWEEEFIKKLEKDVEENNMGKLKVKHIKEIGEEHPILYNCRG